MEKIPHPIIRLETASGSDLSSSLGCAVSLSSGDAVLGNGFGVICDCYQGGVAVAPFGAGGIGAVEVKLAGTVAKGDLLKADGSTGKFTAATATDVANAIALEAGVSDELVAACLLPPPAATGAYLTKAEADALYTAKA